jgi:hypothetical protein
MAKKTKKYADGGNVYADTPHALTIEELTLNGGSNGIEQQDKMDSGSGLQVLNLSKALNSGKDLNPKKALNLNTGEQTTVNTNNEFPGFPVGATMKQRNALRMMTITGPQAHDRSNYESAGYYPHPKMPLLREASIQRLRGEGGTSKALNLNTGKQTAMKKGGAVKKMAKGGKVKVSSASKRADGCATKGKTRGRMI